MLPLPCGIIDESDEQLHALLTMTTLEAESGNIYGRLVVDTQRFCLYVASLYKA